MNDLFTLLGIGSWKPIVSALLLPPVPLLLLVLVGARLAFWRRGVGWTLMLLSLAMLWLSACSGAAEWLQGVLLRVPPALDSEHVARLKRETGADKSTAIVALGAGRQLLAPEYGLSNLRPASLERLRYAVWLSRETGAPLAFTGGVGYGQPPGTPEAEIAARIAAREFGRPLRWTETESRDTRDNAARTVALLRESGITQIVLVTDGYHMPRATRAFFQAANREGEVPMRIVPAPMGLAHKDSRFALRWIPSDEGFALTRNVLHESIGLIGGA